MIARFVNRSRNVTTVLVENIATADTETQIVDASVRAGFVRRADLDGYRMSRNPNGTAVVTLDLRNETLA